MDILFNIKAQTVPAILVVLGFVLMYYGRSMGDAWLAESGWLMVIFGVIVEIFYVLAECLPKVLRF